MFALVGMGWLVSMYRVPFVFAGIFASYIFFRHVLFGVGIGEAIPPTLVALAYGVVYFWLLEKYADNIPLWWLILFTGATGWFLKTIAGTI